MSDIRKYPRTPHLEGSGLQLGDDLGVCSWNELSAGRIVVEEKVDGANSGISFDRQGRLQLQSRGHYLTGGPRERQFDLFKRWASGHTAALLERLDCRYVLYGEWCYAWHSVYYAELPHYFLEYDVLDLETDTFLSTPRRRKFLEGLRVLSSAPLLYDGPPRSTTDLLSLLGRSSLAGDRPREARDDAAHELGLSAERVRGIGDTSGLMEGLYFKVESEERVEARYKYVRSGFVQAVIDSGGHWLDRPLIPNRLRPGVELW